MQVLRQLVLLLVGLHFAGSGVRAHLVAQSLVQLLLQLRVLRGASFVGQPKIGLALAVRTLLLLQNEPSRPGCVGLLDLLGLEHAVLFVQRDYFDPMHHQV